MLFCCFFPFSDTIGLAFIFPPPLLQRNVGGASDRPVPADIWAIVQTKLADLENADKVPVDYNNLRRRGVWSACAIL